MIAGGLIYSRLNHQEETTTVQQVKSTIYAPMGARVSFNLPDGTTGMLNSGSRLTYSLPFNNDRKVSLEGEAWFDVTRDEEHPFELNTGISTVRVLGTSFNLSAYPAEDYVEIVLKEGKVEFLDNQSHVKTIILPSERLVLKDGHIGKTVTDPAKYQAWTKGRMVFNNDLMAEVARRIERWYNVKVVLADKELESYSFRGTFEDDKLDEVFRLLSLTSPITYRITPRKILQDGSYEKEIVTVYLKKR
jgi:ferric-dicitrate binding protein FerR (iron transport regulator)